MFSTAVFSQQTINVGKDDYLTGNLFFSVGGEPVVTAKFIRLVDGSSFFKNEWLKSTVISTQNVQYKGVSIKLDLLDNQFHYLDPKGNEFISSTPVKEITLTDPTLNKSFRFIYALDMPALKKGWHLSLVEGKASLLKTFTKEQNNKLSTEDKLVAIITHYNSLIK